jgi:hypothetical protein
MSRFGVVPSTTLRRRGGLGGLITLLMIIAVAGYFAYNMFPNIFSTLSGSKNGFSGEWVGPVKYKKELMSADQQVGALKLTTPSHLGSIIPSYKLAGTLQVPGQSAPITFEAGQVIGSHDMGSLSGFMDQSGDPGFEKASINGDLKDGRMHLQLQGMGDQLTSMLEGTLQHGKDADFDALAKQVR